MQILHQAWVLDELLLQSDKRITEKLQKTTKSLVWFVAWVWAYDMVSMQN